MARDSYGMMQISTANLISKQGMSKHSSGRESKSFWDMFGSEHCSRDFELSDQVLFSL